MGEESAEFLGGQVQLFLIIASAFGLVWGAWCIFMLAFTIFQIKMAKAAGIGAPAAKEDMGPGI